LQQELKNNFKKQPNAYERMIPKHNDLKRENRNVAASLFRKRCDHQVLNFEIEQLNPN
jgi:hypothetical protein